MNSVQITTAFLPVADPAASARWYSEALGFQVVSVDEWSAVLRCGSGSPTLTLMGPASGIAAAPGLAWATCNLAVADLDQARSELERHGCEPGDVEGSYEVCRFFTASDLDGNTLLVTDR
ncbi:VOC family protein [Nonomuraea soli]|uniref:Catechol 2,3-dioxygenase-like lactoylglutathione lyase family enzyme n=1 Tax=Nonomuraea soli TaxID=1032476 RepID=A0A7W0CHJ0_9ACTN|nr:VOC family protein [Nonomuraea soli]MBA2891312.1 catechol 2,3-dioxygenase-like lactoylglutathione lyase family enzyme [Nonomuraea soli]